MIKIRQVACRVFLLVIFEPEFPDYCKYFIKKSQFLIAYC